MTETLRVGRFRLPRQLLDDDLGLVQTVYSEVVPLRVELMANDNQFEVTAISQHFDPISPGVLTPEYGLILAGGKVRFERI